MMDLKLDVMEDQNIDIDSIEAFSDFIIAQEELHQAEQELFEINRAYENLTALQEVVSKHGWNEVLSDLVGDQISSESLDSSCEGALDKIKGAVKKVGKAVGNFVKANLGIINVFIKKFTSTSKWLRKHMSELEKNGRITKSTEIYTTSYLSDPSKNKYYALDKLFIIYFEYDFMLPDSKINGLVYGDKSIPIIKYDECSATELLKYSDAAVKYLPRMKPTLAHINRGISNLRYNMREYSKNIEDGKKDLSETKSLREASTAETKINKNKDSLRYTEILRLREHNKRKFLHFIIMSCNGLYKEICSRGYKPEFEMK